MGDPGDAPLRRTPTLAKPSFAAIKKSLSHRLRTLFSGRCCTKGTQISGACGAKHLNPRLQNQTKKLKEHNSYNNLGRASDADLIELILCIQRLPGSPRCPTPGRKTGKTREKAGFWTAHASPGIRQRMAP